MAETLRYLRDSFLGNITLGDGNAQEKQQLYPSYDRITSSSDHGDDGIDSDEEIGQPTNDNDLRAEEEQMKPRAAPRKMENKTRFFLLSASILAGGFLLLIFLFTTLRRPSSEKRSSSTAISVTPPLLGLNCGQSIASGMSNNCTFDLLSYSWTPNPCYERETDLEFREWVSSPSRQFGAFPFFLDRNGTVRLTDVTALSYRAGSQVHTTQEEHLGHCIFWMRRIERILEGKGLFTERGMLENGVAHSLHCTNGLIDILEKGPNPLDKDELHAVIEVGFNSC